VRLVGRRLQLQVLVVTEPPEQPSDLAVAAVVVVALHLE
jgi:hypothetical protein